MIERSEIRRFQQQAAEMLDRANVVITQQERDNIEIVELGLGEFKTTGLAIITYFNFDRYSAKELMMFPRQTCAEHRHPPVKDDPGKTETFRCRWGKVWLYVEGEMMTTPAEKVPQGSEDYYKVFHEIELNPGDQYTIRRIPGIGFRRVMKVALCQNYRAPVATSSIFLPIHESSVCRELLRIKLLC